jgi:hypothetical protein
MEMPPTKRSRTQPSAVKQASEALKHALRQAVTAEEKAGKTGGDEASRELLAQRLVLSVQLSSLVADVAAAQQRKSQIMAQVSAPAGQDESFFLLLARQLADVALEICDSTAQEAECQAKLDEVKAKLQTAADSHHRAARISKLQVIERRLAKCIEDALGVLEPAHEPGRPGSPLAHAPPGETYEEEGVMVMDGRFVDVVCNGIKGKFEVPTKRVHLPRGVWLLVPEFAKHVGCKSWQRSVRIVEPDILLSGWLKTVEES